MNFKEVQTALFHDQLAGELAGGGVDVEEVDTRGEIAEADGGLFATTGRVEALVGNDLTVEGNDADVGVGFVVVEEDLPAVGVLLEADGGFRVEGFADALLVGELEGTLQAGVGINLTVTGFGVPS